MLSTLIRRSLLVACLGVVTPATVGASAQDDAGPGVAEAAAVRGFVLDRGPDCAPLVLPRDETLVYRARVALGVLDAAVGTVVQTSRVQPYRSSVLLVGASDRPSDLETATVRLHAKGDYELYSLDSTIEATVLPQDWPRVNLLQVSEGSE